MNVHAATVTKGDKVFAMLISGTYYSHEPVLTTGFIFLFSCISFGSKPVIYVFLFALNALLIAL